MTAGPSETPIGEAVICPFNSLTGPLTMLKPPCPSPALPVIPSARQLGSSTNSRLEPKKEAARK